ncbi:MAG: type-4 uracil-DNA glycosylase [Thermofilum sp.]
MPQSYTSNELCEESRRSLDEVAGRISVCTRCGLHKHRKNAVPGEGNPCARVVFVGEAPGFNEDLQGRPFVGAAGSLLTQLIESAGLNRSAVFITNVVKCRPPQNRDPTDEEISSCLPYLLEQLRSIKPSLLVTLGRHSTRAVHAIFGIRVDSIMSARGRISRVKAEWGEVVLLPTLHPAAALYNPRLRVLLEEDFRELRNLIEAEKGRSRGGTLDDFLRL